MERFNQQMNMQHSLPAMFNLMDAAKGCSDNAILFAARALKAAGKLQNTDNKRAAQLWYKMVNEDKNSSELLKTLSELESELQREATR